MPPASSSPTASTLIADFIYGLFFLALISSCQQAPDVPSIESINPTEGSKGTPITIYTKNFDNDISNFGDGKGQDVVTINGMPTYFHSVGYDYIVICPYGTVGDDGPVVVHYKGKQITGPDFHFSEEPPLQIVSVAPLSGKAGTKVEILATGITMVHGSPDVYFNGVKVEYYSNDLQGYGPLPDSLTRIIREVPKNAGDGLIRLQVDGREAIGPLFDYLD